MKFSFLYGKNDSSKTNWFVLRILSVAVLYTTYALVLASVAKPRWITCVARGAVSGGLPPLVAILVDMHEC
jgi:hypothetical protein